MDASIAHVSTLLVYTDFLTSFVASKILMNAFPERKLARMNGILQTFTGLGMLVGPILGSVLYNIGGF